MTLYAALIYSADVDWTEPQYAEETAEYGEFGKAAASIIRGGAALYPTSTATTVHRAGGKHGEVVTTDGPYAETKEVLNGFYLLECADLDEAVATPPGSPPAWTGGAVEVRPVIQFGTDPGRARGLRWRTSAPPSSASCATRAGACSPR